MNAAFGHLREPILFLANLVRGLNGTLTAANSLNSYANEMGEEPVQRAQRVQLFFAAEPHRRRVARSGVSDLFDADRVGPGERRSAAALYGSLDKTTKLDLSPFVAKAGNIGDLLDSIGYVFLHSGMSPSLAQAATDAANAAATPTAKAQAALYIVLTSSEYQVVQ